MPLSSQPILLVEDSPEDVEATLRAFERSGLRNPITHCATGDEALALMHGTGPDGAAPLRPGIVLLDLNLPGTDGREVLAEIKRSDQLRSIPVVILTTSSDDGDIEACYRAGANSYIQKPVDIEGLFSAIRHLRDYWFEIVILPRGV